MTWEYHQMKLCTDNSLQKHFPKVQEKAPNASFSQAALVQKRLSIFFRQVVIKVFYSLQMEVEVYFC